MNGPFSSNFDSIEYLLTLELEKTVTLSKVPVLARIMVQQVNDYLKKQILKWELLSMIRVNYIRFRDRSTI